MARFHYIPNNLTGGEVSQEFKSKTTLDGYRDNCDLILNGYATKGGGIARRGGTEFIYDVANFATDNSSSNGWNNELTDVPVRGDTRIRGFRAIPFVYSKTESYVIIFGVKDNTSLNTHPIKIINVSDTSQYVSIDTALSASVDTNISSQIPLYNKWGVFTGISNRDHLYELQYTQVNDIMFFAHGSYPPFALGRTSANAFRLYFLPELVATSVVNDTTATYVLNSYIHFAFPFRDAVPNVTLTSNATARGTGATITASSPTGLGGWTGFQSNHVGAYFSHTVGGRTGLFVITAVTSTTSATATILLTLGAMTATSNWAECSWSNFRGWPRTVAAYQNRLLYGGNEDENNKIWVSQLGDLAQLTRDSQISGTTGWTGLASASSSDSFANGIASGSGDTINWILADKLLGIGTEGREYTGSIVIGTSSSSLSLDPQTAIGSAYIQPKKIDNALTFIDNTDTAVREFIFNFSEDNYRSEDISFKASHLPFNGESLYLYTTSATALRVKPRITEFQVQKTTSSQILWFKDRVGKVFICSRDRANQINSWSKMDFSANVDFEDINNSFGDIVESLCAVPSYVGTGDDVFIVTNREMNSSPVYSIERVIGTKHFHNSRYRNTTISSIDSDPIDYTGIHLDYMTKVDVGDLTAEADGSYTYAMGTNLEGETIQVVIEGRYIGGYVVDGSGEINVPGSDIPFTLYSDYPVIMGLKYNFAVQPVAVDAGSVLGSSQSVIKRVDEVVLKLLKTLNLKIGYVGEPSVIYVSNSGTPYDSKIDFDYSAITMDQIDLTFGSNPSILQNPYFTGDKSIRLDGSYDLNNRIILFTDSPYPVHITNILFKGTTYDR